MSELQEFSEELFAELCHNLRCYRNKGEAFCERIICEYLAFYYSRLPVANIAKIFTR